MSEKYLKTHEGIFLVLYTINVGNPVKKVYKIKENKNLNRDYVQEFEVLKESENLEDLADEFIFKQQKDEKPTSGPMSEKHLFNILKITFLAAINMGIKGDFKLGAWTNKGLIYFADLNKDGGYNLIS